MGARISEVRRTRRGKGPSRVNWAERDPSTAKINPNLRRAAALAGWADRLIIV
jgi:hypothetical protein